MLILRWNKNNDSSISLVDLHTNLTHGGVYKGWRANDFESSFKYKWIGWYKTEGESVFDLESQVMAIEYVNSCVKMPDRLITGPLYNLL